MTVLEVMAFLLWYIFITLAGLAALPLAYPLLPHLGDRGAALARPLGLLLWAYLFWLLTSFHILQNDAGGILLALTIVIAFSFAALRVGSGRVTLAEIRAWMSAQKRVLITGEVLFLVAFAAWAFIRSANPDITGTEKPMEQAFINAILRSPSFPPHDPWLSDYAISYYYFGYVMVAMLAKITGVHSGVAFNLASALWFAMSAQAAFGVLYALLHRRLSSVAGLAEKRIARIAGGWALLAPLFVLLVSNLEGLLETLHARGLFWERGADGALTSRFWSWLDVQELVNPPTEPFGWLPERIGGIWWWRASRVLQDYSLTRQSKEIIDEFPFFSFLLADLHPHVLNIPFTLLAVALAFNFYQQVRAVQLPERGLLDALRGWMREEPRALLQTRVAALFRQAFFWLAVVALGSLGFLNIWDFPIYVGLFSAAYILARYQQTGWGWQRLGELIELFVVVILLGVLLYLPFYLGFDSQAGGLLPSLSFFTRGVHLWLMFGSLFVPISVWLAVQWWRRGDRAALRRGLKFAGLLIGGLWAGSFLLSGLVLSVLDRIPRFTDLSRMFFALHGDSSSFFSGGGLLLESFARRLVQPGGWLTLLALLTLVWGLLSLLYRQPGMVEHGSEAAVQSATNESSAFVLLLILLGLGLVVFPEFFYLRDQFGWRMNTIFKFYYQAWLVFALAAAYATAVLLTSLRGAAIWLWRAALALVLFSALLYPFFNLSERIRNLRPDALTLNGNAWMQDYQPDEIDAITWLRAAPLGTLAEAVGGSYSLYGHARVSTISGQPAVLGWPGHESQWRGGSEEMGTRESDIDTLYRTTNWAEALSIIQKYNIRYIYLGSLERETYQVNVAKFDAHLYLVYRNASVTVYETPQTGQDASLAGELSPGSGVEAQP